MLISELIEQLTAQLKARGDLPVYMVPSPTSEHPNHFGSEDGVEVESVAHVDTDSDPDYKTFDVGVDEDEEKDDETTPAPISEPHIILMPM